MKKRTQGDRRFQTHIPEPKWQIVVSVIIALLLAGIELLILLKII